jgi:hypothetical protein
MFGEERLHALLGELADDSATDVARKIDDAVMDFAPGLPGDDVAILIARFAAVPATRPTGEHARRMTRGVPS